jgi:ribose-phosphate pyrophosphokinase
MIIYSTTSYAYLANELGELCSAPRGGLEKKDFPDGEHYHRILDDVAGQDAVVVGGTVSETETLELYDLACGLVHEGAATLTLVIPYMGYSTMDRATRSGEVVKAKTRARLLSLVPQAVRGNRVVLVDLHVEGLQHYFEGGAHPFHVYAKPLVLDAARRLGGKDFVMACTDAGRAKWVESLAVDLNVTASFVFKRRDADGKTQVTAVSAQVAGKRVVIYDDMIRTGGSLINAARAYRDAGAESLVAITTHGVFPGDALERIRDTGLFAELVCTNTHPRALELAATSQGFLAVESMAPLLARFLRRA